jgi:hypothetical protein
MTTSSWTTVGTAGFSTGSTAYESLGINSLGTPYLAYIDNANGNKATVMIYNGSNWVAVGAGAVSAGAAQYDSLALNSGGVPYLAYEDNTNGYKATVMMYNGSNWVAVGNAGFSAGGAFYESFALNGSNTPYLAYADNANGNKATVMTYNGSSWVTVGSAGFSAGSIAYDSLAVNSSTGALYLAYADDAYGNKATVMQYANGLWSAVGTAGFTAGATSSESLAINSSGNLYLAYSDVANGNKATVMMYNGSQWVTVGTPDFSAGAAYYESLKVTGNGTLYLAYADAANGSKTTVMTYNGSSWVVAGTPGFSAANAQYESLAIGSGNAPYLAYADGTNGSKATVMSLGASSNVYLAGAVSDLSVDTTSTPLGGGFQQLATVAVQGYSSDYTLSGYYGQEILTSKSSGHTITINFAQPLAGANNTGATIQFLDGDLSITLNRDPGGVLWTAWVTYGVAPGGDTSAWYNANAQQIPSTFNGLPLDLGSAPVQGNLLNTADNSRSAGFYGGTPIGLLPSAVTAINNSTPNAILTGILGGGSNQTATFISGDSITLTGGNTTFNLFDFTGGTPLPANTTVSGVNTLDLLSRAAIGSATTADSFSAWSGLTTINAIVTATGSSAGGNGLVNLAAGSSTAVSLTANDNYSSTAQVGAITVQGGSSISITQNLSTADGSPISGGGISITGGSATTSVTVNQSAAVAGAITDSAVIINDKGSISTVVLGNYGSGSVINDNSLSNLSLSGSGGITVNAAADNSNISLITNGALGGSNSNIFTLGNGNNLLSDIVLSAGSSTNITVGSGSNQISTGINSVNITLGLHGAIIDRISVAANGSLSSLTAITGAHAGDTITMADATQFNSSGVTAANVTATGGDATTLTGWVNAALSAQGVNLATHAETWFNFGGNTYLIEQANTQGAAFAAGNTLVKLVGMLNESAAVLNGHALTL